MRLVQNLNFYDVSTNCKVSLIYNQKFLFEQLRNDVEDQRRCAKRSVCFS